MAVQNIFVVLSGVDTDEVMVEDSFTTRQGAMDLLVDIFKISCDENGLNFDEKLITERFGKTVYDFMGRGEVNGYSIIQSRLI